MRHWIVSLIVVVLVLVSGRSPARAAETDAPAKQEDAKKKSSGGPFEFNKKEPIYITSDWMEVDQKKNTITYKGRVVTLQGEMTMRSETLTAYYQPDMKLIRQIVAEGNVRATQCNRVATGDKIVFDDPAKTVTLTGSPVMRQGNSQVSGTRIVYYTEEDRSVVEGKDQQRVRATVFPEELQAKEKGDDCPGKGK